MDLTKEQITGLLAELGQEMADRGQFAELFVVGGVGIRLPARDS